MRLGGLRRVFGIHVGLLSPQNSRSTSTTTSLRSSRPRRATLTTMMDHFALRSEAIGEQPGLSRRAVSRIRARQRIPVVPSEHDFPGFALFRPSVTLGGGLSGWRTWWAPTERRQPREIDGKGKTVRELLAGRKFSIDYYQREYKWQTKQVAELIDDLSAKFLESYEPGHERSAVAEYGHYFLGSIIISDKDGQKFIIDGQQRLTTLTLLLIYLQHQLQDAEQRGQLAELIFSQKFGKRSFNLDIPERTACMEALYTGKDFVARTTHRSRSPTSLPAIRTSTSRSPQNCGTRRFRTLWTG